MVCVYIVIGCCYLIKDEECYEWKLVRCYKNKNRLDKEERGRIGKRRERDRR